MKTVKAILIVAILTTGLIFQSCQKNETDDLQQTDNIMPERFKVDIPNSISSSYSYKDANVDTLQGNDIYEHLRNFVAIGESAAEVTGEIILSIALHNLSQPVEFTFTGDDDGRPKHCVIVPDATFEGYTWQYKLTMTDIGTDENNENTAMQIFWNKSPIKGIAMLNPYNIDRNTDPEFAETIYRIDYSEAGELGYQHHMIVTIDGLPLADPLTDPFSISTLKMFVGKNGDVVSIFGNSEHPNATFFNDDNSGFDWAFTAAAKNSEDIATAEVGLPSNLLDSGDRYTLLVDNSIHNVFEDEIYGLWPWIDPETVEAYLYNTEAPGFFDQYGFIQGGTAPSSDYNELLNIIAGLTPYNPAEIHNLDLNFD